MAFKPLTINTAPSAAAHILAQDDAAIYDSIWGGQSGIAPTGTKMTATKINDNLIRLGSGVVYCSGFAGRIRSGDTHDVPITSGSAGQNRIDLIVAEFLRSGSVDTITIKVKQGQSTSGTPVQPTVTQQDIDASGTLYELPLYAARLTGTSLGAPVRVADVLPTAKQLIADLASASGAGMVGIKDAGGIINASDVEGALYEVKTQANKSQTDIGLLGLRQISSAGLTINATSYDMAQSVPLKDGEPPCGNGLYALLATVDDVRSAQLLWLNFTESVGYFDFATSNGTKTVGRLIKNGRLSFFVPGGGTIYVYAIYRINGLIH